MNYYLCKITELYNFKNEPDDIAAEGTLEDCKENMEHLKYRLKQSGHIVLPTVFDERPAFSYRDSIGSITVYVILDEERMLEFYEDEVKDFLRDIDEWDSL